MDSISFVPFRNDDGLELVINTKTGECFASVRAIARMCECNESTIRSYVTARNLELQKAKVPTATGFKTARILNENQILDCIEKYNPTMLRKFAQIGLRMFLHQLAGFQYQVVEQIKPKTALELAKEQVKLLEELELKELQIKSLEEDNLRQAEVIDELFDYSSIIRIAKFNNCDEKAFNWRVLKAGSQALKLEIKKVPCPRFGEKNLYSHDVWRYCYPGYKLPETTTLVIQR